MTDEAPQPALPSPEPPPPAAEAPVPPRRLRWAARLLIGLLILIFFFAGAAGGGVWYLERWARRGFGAPGLHAFRFEPHTPARQAARRLRDEGVVGDDLLFLAWLKIHNRARQLQAGEFSIQTPVTPERLIQALGHGAFERPLTIPEGWTARQIARRLTAERWIKNEREWLDLVARPLGAEAVGEPMSAGAEGFCFPETYLFKTGARPEEIMRRMLAKFRQEWTWAEPARRNERSMALSLLQVVALASMVEREARTPGEMPAIASVYLNRLGRGMKMQCCATVRFALGDVWDRPLTYGDLKIDSPYNTYLHPGLPPGPIANPGRAAIEAVLRPAHNDFLFYVYIGENRHAFSRTYAEHMKAVREARRRDPKAAGAELDSQ